MGTARTRDAAGLTRLSWGPRSDLGSCAHSLKRTIEARWVCVSARVGFLIDRAGGLGHFGVYDVYATCAPRGAAWAVGVAWDGPLGGAAIAKALTLSSAG